MENVIGFIVPSKQEKMRVEGLFEKELLSGKLIVEIMKHNNLVNQAKNLAKKGANAIIARGGTYSDIKDNLNIPVVNLRTSTGDILQALGRAKKISQKVHLILQKSINFNVKEWEEVLNIQIQIDTFNTIHQVDGIISRIKDKDEKSVLVGGIIVTEKAESKGLKNIFVTNTDNNIIETYNRANELVDSIKNEKKKLTLLTSILDNIDDAVIVINKEKEMEHFNDKAIKFLHKNSSRYMEKENFLDIFPDINFIFEVLEGRVISNHIMKINDFTLNVTAVPLEVNDEKVGIVCVIQDVTRIQKLEKKLRYQLSQKGLNTKYTFNDILTKDEEMIRVINSAKKFALNNKTILIYGESGTGKELFAQSIHNFSERKEEPFVAINCGALSENLLESELFGYEEGAFTGARKGGKQGLFELAHGGTIFLDEINSISPNLQVKLLRVLEEREVMRLGSDYIIPLDVRVVAATNEDLMNKILNNEFRRDLFYRLSILELRIPPLREKKKDIILLFKKFLKEITNEEVRVTKELEKKLQEHMWLGNIRELKNVAERYSLLESTDKYDHILGGESMEHSKKIMIDDSMKIDLDEINRVVEDLVIQNLINKGLGKNEIAGLLGISRTALWKKINR